ncbi:MAG: hypothetical protein IT372_11355 [Polyangiaceae bacterium]|nr:hypothetical protein [Polyangiaceae bacterium]
MRRTRRDGTKVWHNPELQGSYTRGHPSSSGLPRPTQSGEDRRAAKEHRAALEALFTPKKDPELQDDKAGRGRSASGAGSKAPGRIVLTPPPQSDPRAQERQKLLGKLLSASGRPGISKATNDFLRAGYTFPMEQDVYLQLLEHTDEERVHEAIEALAGILAGELPKRRAVLESRLRRIEQFAEEAATREAAERLRRQVSGRPEAPGGGSDQTPDSGAR